MTKQYKRQAVDEERYRWIMIAAALRGTTVKRWIEEAIDEKMARDGVLRITVEPGNKNTLPDGVNTG